MELRSRVVAFVEEGHGQRGEPSKHHWSERDGERTALSGFAPLRERHGHFKRESGGLLPKAQGNHAEGKLARFNGWLRDRLKVKGDLTLDEIVAEMATVHGLTVHRGSVGKWLHRLGLSHKKNLLASEILRPDVAERRRVWVGTFQPDLANMLERMVFIDETSLKTNLVKTTGWAPVGKRLVDHAPFGHWHTQRGAPPVRR